MNSQWKLVPVEPTETMVINGFESEPDECFSDEEVWEQYQGMSGCQQAAFRAKLCWAAMVGSAPAPTTAWVPEIVAYHVVDEFGQKKVLLPGAEGIKRHRTRGATLRALTDVDHVTRLVAERDALQQRLNAADQRIDELERDKVRIDWLAEQPVDTLYLDDGRIIDIAGRVDLRDAIDAAIAMPVTVEACDD